MEPHPVLHIQTLGSFSVSVGQTILSDNSARAGQVWKLFKYLSLIHKSEPTRQTRISDGGISIE